MKKNILFAAGLILAVACTQEIKPVGDFEKLVINATGSSDVKSSLSEDYQTVLWNAGEKIGAFYGNEALGSFTGTNTAPAKSAAFESDAVVTANLTAGADFYAFYPYSAVATCADGAITMPVSLSSQEAAFESFADGAFPSVAKSSTTEMVFKNICGGIKFMLETEDVRRVTFTAADDVALAADAITVSFSDGSPVVTSVTEGTNRIVLSAPQGEALESEAWYYIAALPAVLENGFTMTFETSASKATLVSTARNEIKASVFGNLGVVDEDLEWKAPVTLNLSENGTANCYLISEEGTYYLDPVKGNTDESIGEVASAAVLWETVNTSEAPEIGEIVYNAEFRNGKVWFKATGTPGNALIAAKDAEGTILWSWHIWVSDTKLEDMEHKYTFRGFPSDKGVNADYTYSIVLDRNLGAISGVPGEPEFYGLMYQWGRKDPFMGSDGTFRLAKSNPEITSVPGSALVGTIEYSIAHPNVYIGTTHSPDYEGDWLIENNPTLWGGGGENEYSYDTPKGLYDPCPVGYEVPYTDIYSGQMTNAHPLGYEYVANDGWYDPATNCFNLTTAYNSDKPCYYPVAGCHSGPGTSLYDFGSQGMYVARNERIAASRPQASLTILYNHCYELDGIHPFKFNSKAACYSVRCVKSMSAL